MITSKKYNLVAYVLILAGVWLMIEFAFSLILLAVKFLAPLIVFFVALAVAFVVMVLWLLGSLWAATKIGELTFDRWSDD